MNASCEACERGGEWDDLGFDCTGVLNVADEFGCFGCTCNGECINGNDQLCGFQVLEDSDLPGSDISLPVPLGSFSFSEGLALCSEICRAIPYCQAFSLVDVGIILNPVPWCFLKSSVPGQSSRTRITSGVRNGQDAGCNQQPRAQFEMMPMTDLFGGDLFLPCIDLSGTSSLDDTTQQCADICAIHDVCVAFTAVEPDGFFFHDYRCCLKGSVPSKFNEGGSEHTNSGIKVPL